MVRPPGFGWVWQVELPTSPCPTALTAMDGCYIFDGILMFHLWYINIPQPKPIVETQRRSLQA